MTLSRAGVSVVAAIFLGQSAAFAQHRALTAEDIASAN
jgi:hypothetical protein